jgi:hypothetical protein
MWRVAYCLIQNEKGKLYSLGWEAWRRGNGKSKQEELQNVSAFEDLHGPVFTLSFPSFV